MPLTLIRADITQLKTDAIVNAANNQLTWGTGVCGSIFNQCDTPRLMAACAQIGYCATGDAVITPPFGLPCGYIIHTVGPIWQDGKHNEETLLRSCYTRSLDIAQEYHLHSIAFPLISSGNYGYPKEQALSTALSAIGDWLLENDTELQVYLTLFDRPAYEAGNALYADIRSYIDDQYVATQIRSRCEAKHLDIEYNACCSQEMSYDFALTDTAEAPLDSTVFASRVEENRFTTDKLMKCRASSAPSSPVSSAPTKDFPKPINSPKKQITSAEEYIYEEEHLASILSPEEHARSIIRRLRDLIHQTHESFQEMLFRLIDERGMTDATVYKRANIDRRLFSKIRSNSNYHPAKPTVLALAIALRLNLDQTSDLLRRAGFAFSPNSTQDLIVEFCIQRGIYDIHRVNEILFELGETTLGTQSND